MNRNRIRIIIFSLAFLPFLQTCLFVPAVSEKQTRRCHLVTRKLELDTKSINSRSSTIDDINMAISYISSSAIIAPTSLIISGSIVIVGNTIHWIEQEGTCSDGLIRNAIQKLASSLSSAGRWLAE